MIWWRSAINVCLNISIYIHEAEKNEREREKRENKNHSIESQAYTSSSGFGFRSWILFLNAFFSVYLMSLFLVLSFFNAPKKYIYTSNSCTAISVNVQQMFVAVCRSLTHSLLAFLKLYNKCHEKQKKNYKYFREKKTLSSSFHFPWWCVRSTDCVSRINVMRIHIFNIYIFL